jgi:small nuclear ribonucleoprotein (snRNP)-like protein
VPQDFSITYIDSGTSEEVIANNITGEVSNLVYEDKIRDDKSNIFLLKAEYLPVILNEIETLMPYKEGSTQYIGRSLVRGDNIRLYQ